MYSYKKCFNLHLKVPYSENFSYILLQTVCVPLVSEQKALLTDRHQQLGDHTPSQVWLRPSETALFFPSPEHVQGLKQRAK